MNSLKKIINVLFIVLMTVFFTGCGNGSNTNSKGFNIDDESSLEILEIKPYVVDDNKIYTEVRYKLSGKNTENQNKTFLQVLTSDKFDEIQNGQVERINRLDGCPTPHGDRIKNEDGSETIYLSTKYTSDGNYKALIVFDHLQNNEKAVVADFIITEEVASTFKGEKEKIDELFTTKQEAAEEAQKEFEAQQAIKNEISERPEYVKKNINDNTVEYKIYLYKDEEIHLTGSSNGNMDITLSDGAGEMDSYFHPGTGSFETWLGDGKIRAYCDGYYYLQIIYNNISGYEIQWTIH